MKKNKLVYRLITLLTITLCLLCITNNVYAGWGDQVNPNGGAGVSEAAKAMNIIIGIFQTVAVGVATIMLVVLAIKYMSSAPSEKAEIKKHAVVYIVGAVMAYGAAGIVQLFKSFTQEALG